ncbi:MAG: YigZ family protein [Desulfuromonas sp.]|nr:YigZ family protein [Desulfuromonas sp.]
MMPARYSVPAQWHRTTTEVKRSRFITTVANTAEREHSRAFIRQVQQEFSNANHNCWACVIGAPGCTLQAGMSDDGEPHGAAGKPMLTTLLHTDIGDITVVVSRYFGGIRLGKGGMVRAYTAAVLNNLETLPRREKISYQQLRIELHYPLLEPIHQLISSYEAQILHCDYAGSIQMTLLVPRENCARFCKQITHISAGSISVEVDKQTT